MERFIAIIKKEIIDALRDSKSMGTALLMPVFIAAVSYGSINFLVSLQSQSTDVTLPIRGQEYIAPLVQVFEEQGIKIVDAPQNPELSIINREHDMVLVVPADFVEDFRQQRTAQLNLLSDHSQTESQSKVARIKFLIHQWSLQTGTLRLITRNVSPSIANAVRINEVNVTTDQRLASKILSSLPMFFMMIAFVSGFGMIADMTSGERERRSLEPLLINPVTHSSVFFGKWGATVLVTIAIAALGIALQFFAVNASPVAELGLRLDMGPEKYMLIMLIIIPVTLFACALGMLVSLFARSFKDSQAYNGLLVMLPMAPGFYLIFNSGSAETWQMLVPILGPTALFVDIISGDGASFVHVLLSSFTSIAAAAICAIGGIYLFKREKTIFG